MNAAAPENTVGALLPDPGATLRAPRIRWCIREKDVTAVDQ